MDTAPWHAERSFLKSGWYNNDSYSAVLPQLQRIPMKDALPELSSLSFKNIAPRPYSAEVCRRRRADPGADAYGRIRPLPSRLQLLPEPHLSEVPGASARSERNKVETVESPFFEGTFGDETKLAELLASAPATKCLRLPSHYWLSVEFLTSLGAALPRLQELNLRNTAVTDAVVAAVVAGCPDLRSLDLGENAALQDIGRVAEVRELRELRLPRCINAVTSDFVASLQNTTLLEVLDLSFCPKLGSQGLQELSKGCRNLTWLDLVSCPGVSDEGVTAVISKNAGLEHLGLALNAELSDHHIGKAIRCLKRLKYIDISGCPRLCHHTPMALAKNCEYLEDASFASLQMFSDDDMRRLFERCSRLRSLDVSGCLNLSYDAVTEGLSRLPTLEKLVLNSVPGISDDMVMHLKTDFPGCTIQRHARKHVDADDLTYILRMPPKNSVLQARVAAKPKMKKSKGKKG